MPKELNADMLARARPFFQAAFNKPLALAESQKEYFVNLLADSLGYHYEEEEKETPESVQMYGDIAVIPFSGSVVSNAPSWMERYYGLVNPQRFAADLRETVDNESVREIILYVNSYGGTVDGTREAYKAVEYAVKSKKLKYTHADNACSAGYWVPSPSPNISAPPTACISSIGVIAGLTDMSKYYESMGISFEWVRSGKSKALGQRGEEVTDEVIADTQDTVDALFDVLWGDITKYRDLPSSLKSGVDYIGTQAINHNLIDKIDSFQNLLNTRIEQTQQKTKGFLSMNFSEYQAAHPNEAAEALKTEFERGTTNGQSLAEQANQNAEADAENNKRVAELEAQVQKATIEATAQREAKEALEAEKAEAKVKADVDAYWEANVPDGMYAGLSRKEEKEKAAAYKVAVESMADAEALVTEYVSDYNAIVAQVNKGLKADPDKVTLEVFGALTQPTENSAQISMEVV